MTIPPKKAVPPPEPRDPWPEIDGLATDAVVDLRVESSWYETGKAVIDYGLSVLLLPLALPLIGLAAVLTKLTSPGPAFYTQVRLGQFGRPYRIVKIRTMRHNCELKSGIKWSVGKDARVTPVGRFLRATHIDELPQLFNVLRGEMSLVGPRPERPEVIKAKGLEHLVPGYRLRMLTKPGVTGLAQLQLPADSDVTSVRYKVVYDLYYVQHGGPLLDARLLVGTLLKAVGCRPRLIRRLFFLPSRRAVAEVFRTNLNDEPRSLAQLQPA